MHLLCNLGMAPINAHLLFESCIVQHQSESLYSISLNHEWEAATYLKYAFVSCCSFDCVNKCACYILARIALSHVGNAQLHSIYLIVLMNVCMVSWYMYAWYLDICMHGKTGSLIRFIYKDARTPGCIQYYLTILVHEGTGSGWLLWHALGLCLARRRQQVRVWVLKLSSEHQNIIMALLAIWHSHVRACVLVSSSNIHELYAPWRHDVYVRCTAHRNVSFLCFNFSVLWKPA